jgi:hypothetical protein
MQKVWMVWQTVDFGTDWLVGVFSSKSKADAAMDDFFADWLDDRGLTAAQFKASKDDAPPWSDIDDPFFVTQSDVQ